MSAIPAILQAASAVVKQRGEAYYRDGAVRDLQQSPRGYTATVMGREAYHVRIEYDEVNGIPDIACSCPYERERVCKHMVAVVWGVEGLNN